MESTPRKKRRRVFLGEFAGLILPLRKHVLESKTGKTLDMALLVYAPMSM